MDISLSFFLIFSMLVIPSSSTTRSTLNSRSSLSVEKPNDILISPNGVFAAGFHPVGDNAFILAIWFAKSSSPTVVWTANRDQPVNGKASKLSLLKYGNLILTDAGQNTIWSTTTSAAVVQLALLNTGNLVLNSSKSSILWQSFDSPTDTLLPLQMFTRYTTLVSSRSQTNHSSGFYKLLFDNNNLLSLLYNGPEVSSIYWPDPQLMFWESGRTLFNSSKIAILDTSGRNPTGVRDVVEGEEEEGCERLETWARKKMNGSEALWIEEIIDPVMMGGCERSKMENLVRVAVQCLEADTDARPTMREVVEMLLGHEDSHDTA